MVSIENSKIGKELTRLREANINILGWIDRFNDLNYSTLDLLNEANHIFHNDIIGANISTIQDLIIFDKESKDIRIDYIDTSDEIICSLSFSLRVSAVPF